MSEPFVPSEVIRAAINPPGLTHASLFLAKAFDEIAIPSMPEPRVDIHKCAGANLAACLACVRKLAPAGAGQKWAESEIHGEACSMFASVDAYGDLYRVGPGDSE